MTPFPKIRAIEAHPFAQDGQPALLLRDPQALTDRVLIIPQELAPALVLCDGTRDVDGLASALLLQFGLRVGKDVLARLVEGLDEALLLENERYARILADAIEAYRSAPYRPPLLAGESYPADPHDLRRALQGYVDDLDPQPPSAPGCRGLVSPHIDYERGGPAYARVWLGAMDAAREAELVILLGTDHAGGEKSPITLTRQNYATPFGVLPTAQGVVDGLAEAMGPDLAFGDELNHRREHSIELAAIWLQYVREEAPCEVVPVLTGSFYPFVAGEAELAEDPAVAALVEVLRDLIADREALVVAAADLSHVGPAFDGPAVDRAALSWLQTSDEEVIAQTCAGDAEGFFDVIRRTGDRTNVCGLPPIYLALRLLQPSQGQLVAYDQCPADERGTSWVSVCGVLWE